MGAAFLGGGGGGGGLAPGVFAADPAQCGSSTQRACVHYGQGRSSGSIRVQEHAWCFAGRRRGRGRRRSLRNSSLTDFESSSNADMRPQHLHTARMSLLLDWLVCKRARLQACTFFLPGGGGGAAGGAFLADCAAGACFGLLDDGGGGGGGGGGAHFASCCFWSGSWLPVPPSSIDLLASAVDMEEGAVTPALRSNTSASALVGACTQPRCSLQLLHVCCME